MTNSKKPHSSTSIHISRSKGKTVTSRTYKDETGFSMTETDVKRSNRVSTFDILGAFTSSIAIIVLIVVCFCYFFNVNFNLDTAVDELANGDWNRLDWAELTRALDSLTIRDPSSWGAFEGFANFLNTLLSVFRGFGYVAGSIVYCFGFVIEILAVLFGS